MSDTMTVKRVLNHLLHVFSGAMLLFILLFTQVPPSLSQGPEGFFNTSSSYAIINSKFDPRARTSLSFRTCASGQLLLQEGLTGDFVSLTLASSGVLELAWQVNGRRHAVELGANLIDNRWHDVDIIYRLGSVTLSVSGSGQVVLANSTHSNDFYEINLEQSNPMLYVGQGFTGCILQGAGVVLNDSSVRSSSVSWGKCPLPNKGSCDGYLIDHCFSQPCHKYSKCVSLPDGYRCDCTLRYGGRHCENDLGPLCNRLENFCQNGGTCQEDKAGNFTTCACPARFTGAHCEIMVDNMYCDFMPCRNGGTCNINELRNDYVCTCPQGFAGTDCELNIDECQSSPCQNNGSCTDEINAYTCDCTGTGYRGPNCEENINECEENNPCYTGSQCFDRYGGYICNCPPGFGGKNCDQEVNECDSSPCQNLGTCMDSVNGYLCNCRLGFAGKNCEENIDDCFGVACPANSHCVDGINSFSCVCDPGYSGAVPHCQEIDECAEAPCLNGATCHDQLNRFSCSCANGFLGDRCEINIDECENQPCLNGATCIDGAGTYTCECVPGYTSFNCETDINECESSPCRNGAPCTDKVNDFACECPPGWEGKTCVDNIDECEPKPCMHGQCIDLLNNFTCNCDPGFAGYLCDVNINECESSPCFNGGTCTDLINDFSCQCPENFMGKSCLEVYNACGSSPCQHGATCQTNIPSHEYTCICSIGFTGSQCEIDIDDCEGVVCPTGKICVDQQNAYECQCPVGFSGDNCSVNIDECSSNPCVNGTCIDGIGAYACECPPGLTGKHCESDIDECSDSPCVHGICQNMFGTYLCYCTPGYTGIHCDIEFNECLSMPCKNNAVCNDLVNNYSCTCVPGFSGRNCETDTNECASNPCLNGATCYDQINKYECSCVDGFSGQNCEVNIDECASQPCLNDGICIDLVNEFSCNCSNTGFTGMFCEINIDECASNPCNNGAWCEDQIKDYKCHCYSGYEGKNCEVDIEECASSPCLNSALCLENSNQTLYEMNYLGFFPSFSYESASGYRCICSSGFTGENCETNIDDCEFNECKNGICIDGINDYYCACHLGYAGQYCGREINECQMLEPCENGATCIDLIADYRCECLPEFGGKTCQTRLIGCQNIECENGATCIPSLDDNGFHSYTCKCMPGFYGKLCENATTFSFNSTDSVSVKRYNDLMDDFSLKFHFRTTLADGLISSGYISDSTLMYLLYLWNGMIKVDIYNGTFRLTELFSKNDQNDSTWKMVQLHFEPNKVSLNVSGWNVFKPLNFSLLNFSVTFGYLEHWPNFFMSKDVDQIPGFIGCVQDISINGDVIIPHQNSELFGAIEGCYRKDQCAAFPCHNGFCKDNWLSYECICSRPYFGSACEYSYEAATFGFRNEKSRAEVLIPAEEKMSLGYELDISFFLRTRNESGVVFYVGSSLNGSSNCNTEEQNVSFLLARLVMGKLQVILTTENGDTKELNHMRQLDTGDNYFVQVIKNNSTLTVKVNGTVVSSALSPDSSLCQEVLYIAGLPQIARQKRQAYSEVFHSKFDILLLDDFSYFKGIVHDFRVNDKEVIFYKIDGEGVGFPEVFGEAQLFNVRKGVLSDDPCSIFMPCLHNSECKDVWNEYVCICPDDYRGKNCQEKKPCAENHCPMDSECRNLDVGYECVASAAFNGKQSGVQYQIENVSQNITNITFSFRSMYSGTILWLESRQKLISNHFLHIEIVHDTLEVKWDLGPSYENLALHKTVSQKFKSDASGWHDVELWFDGDLVHLKVSGNPENLSEDNYSVGLSELLNEGANVYVGYKPHSFDSNYKGCLRDIRIGGLLLSFFNTSVFNDVNNPFHLVQESIEIGCILCWDEDCVHGKCNSASESYTCDCDVGYEGQNCDIDMCISHNPCMNGGACYHENSLMCSCPKEFAGQTCSEINYCEPQPCQNGGTCNQVPGSGTYECLCSKYFEGKNCEQKKILDCNSVRCEHGTCLNVDIEEINKFKCLCHDGYEGNFCDKITNFCASSPCLNNANCTVYEGHNFAAYQCHCPSGFTGIHCELNVDECELDPCLHGRCIDGIGTYKCECHPGYKGQNCQDRIQHCTEIKNVCYNGTCVPDPSTNSYKCECRPGYIGSHCSVFNECEESKCNYQGNCQPGLDDHELLFVHKCDCVDGFSGTDCTTKLSISGSEDDTNLILMILIPVLSLFLLCLLIGSVVFLRVAKKKRATRGTYSPSRQEMFGSRVEMNHVMKPPPEERLI